MQIEIFNQFRIHQCNIIVKKETRWVDNYYLFKKSNKKKEIVLGIRTILEFQAALGNYRILHLDQSHIFLAKIQKRQKIYLIIDASDKTPLVQKKEKEKRQAMLTLLLLFSFSQNSLNCILSFSCTWLNASNFSHTQLHSLLII